jgi:hypothetical protein
MALFSSRYFEPTPYSPYYLNLREQDLEPLHLLQLYLLQLHLLDLLYLLHLYLEPLYLNRHYSSESSLTYENETSNRYTSSATPLSRSTS